MRKNEKQGLQPTLDIKVDVSAIYALSKREEDKNLKPVTIRTREQGERDDEGRKREEEKEKENTATCIKLHGRRLFYRLCSKKKSEEQVRVIYRKMNKKKDIK